MQGDAFAAEEAGAELAVAGKADAGTIMAKRFGARRDQPQDYIIPLYSVSPDGGAVGGYEGEWGDSLEGGNDAISIGVIVLVVAHEFNEAEFTGVSMSDVEELAEFGGINLTAEDHVEFGFGETGGQECIHAFKDGR